MGAAAAGSQGQPDAVEAVAARADDEKPVERASQAVRYEALHLPPGRPSSGRRSGRDRRGSEATRSGRGPRGEGPPEPNGHARTATPADSNGGSADVPYYDRLRSGDPPGLSRGATEGAEGAPPDRAASLGDGCASGPWCLFLLLLAAWPSNCGASVLVLNMLFSLLGRSA